MRSRTRSCCHSRATSTAMADLSASAGLNAERRFSWLLRTTVAVRSRRVSSLRLNGRTARLVPADGWPQADSAIVDGTLLASIALRIDPSCPVEVTRAVGAHPALRTTTGRDAGLIVDCGSDWGRDVAVPRLVLRQGPPELFDASTVLWSQAATGAHPPVASFAPRVRGRLDAPRAGDEVLLAAGEVPLVIRRAGSPHTVETSLDLAAAELTGTDSTPLLFAVLADAALGREGRMVRAVEAMGRGVPAGEAEPFSIAADHSS